MPNAFRNARSEKEENRQYLTTLVQQVRTSILSYDGGGNVQLINPHARQFRGVTFLKSLHDLNQINHGLYQVLLHLQTGRSALYKTEEFQITIPRTELRVRGTEVKLFTHQHIQSELRQQELESWQNLTPVLRHEIMISITPITSLTSTLREIPDHDLKDRSTHFELNPGGAEDLREGLITKENQPIGMIKFIDAYREYTPLPTPQIRSVALTALPKKVVHQMKPDIRYLNVRFTVSCEPEHLVLPMVEKMIEQVLINLLKNTIESMRGMPDGRMELAGKHADEGAEIEVAVNGPGIIKEPFDRIFVPFFTTKKTGSSIGLSLSRQIMQVHEGTLTDNSRPNVRTVFRVKF